MIISAATDAALKAGRLTQGVEVKFSDGQTLQFGPSLPDGLTA